jgi:hypothetical protein
LGRGTEVIADAPHSRKERLKITKAYIDSLNDQKIDKGLKLGFLYIVIEDFHSLNTHTMSLSNSSEMEDQIAMTFAGVMDEAMIIVQAKEVTAGAASLST